MEKIKRNWQRGGGIVYRENRSDLIRKVQRELTSFRRERLIEKKFEKYYYKYRYGKYYRVFINYKEMRRV